MRRGYVHVCVCMRAEGWPTGGGSGGDGGDDDDDNDDGGGASSLKNLSLLA